MAGRGKRPDGVQKYKRTWDVAKVADGEKFTAWVAGPHIRVKVHKGKKLKACLKFHAGSNECPGCKAHMETQWYAYLPVYRDPDKYELMCAFTEVQWDTLDKLEHLQGVIIGREYPSGKYKGFQCGLWINPRISKEKYQPTDDVRKKERCIASPLIIMWKYTELLSVAQLLEEDEVKPTPQEIAKEPTLTKAEQSELATEILRRQFALDGKPVAEVPLSDVVREVLYRKYGHSDPRIRNGKS